MTDMLYWYHLTLNLIQFMVSRQSALNNSKFFHVVDGLPSDIVHDILEGVLPLHVKVM